MSHTVVIVNPSSAGGRTGKKWSKLSALLREAYGPFEDCFTEAAGDGERLTRQAITEGAATVIAVGGDGSINDVVNGFFDARDPARRCKTALGVIPLGTGGDFIRSIGVPRDPVLAARALAAAAPRLIDVGRIHLTGHDGEPKTRYFINVASFGIAGLVDKYVNASKKSLPGTLAFALATLRAGLAYKNSPVRIRVDDGEWKTGPVYNVSLANARFFGGGMKVAPEALLHDGLLELVRFGDMGLWDLIRDGRDLYSGRHVDLAEVSTGKVRSLDAESLDGREVLLDVDGEQPGRLPARFEIVPAALLLRAPELPQ
ncbi:MAG: diacylglycerol kinase family protein [Polyangia bacterium]